MIIGGLDVGTTGCKIALYDENAVLQDTFYREYDVLRKNGKHEIDFETVKNGVITLLKQAVSGYRVTALGVTSFGETFAMLDGNDSILAPPMLYTDPRGSEECAGLVAALGKERLGVLTGVAPHPMYSIGKIMWLKKHMPESYSKAERILLGEDYIVYLLTGNARIDYSLAARTGAFDIENKCWSHEVFNAAGIDASLMSMPVPAGTQAGLLKTGLKALLGIDYDISIVNGCHDQVAAMLGAGVLGTTQAMDGTGTVECIPTLLDTIPNDPEFYECGYSVVPFPLGKYACYALSFTGGAVLKWFRDNFSESEKESLQNSGGNVYALLDARAPEEPTEILVLPHFAGAATPYMDNDAKAAFTGITLETTKYDLYKALMEGTSYEMLLNFNRMMDYTDKICEIRATGGGAASDIWLQIKADVMGTDVTAISAKEVGAAGTAALAGVAVGAYDDLENTVRKMAEVRRVFKPDKSKHSKYKKLYKKYAGLYQAIRNSGA